MQKILFASLVRLKAASFSKWGLMRRWELVSQFLWPQFVQHGARSCGLSGFRFWVHISSPFLGPAILTHAAEVPFLGPQCGPQFRAKSRALNALLGRLFEFFFAIYMTAMKRRRECWVDWQRFQDNESDMFKNNDARQTHGAAFKIQSLNVCKGLKEALYFGARIRAFLGL